MENQKYTTAEEIMNMVNRVHPSKKTSVTDFIEWCAECEANHIKEVHHKIKYEDVEIEVVDGKARIPCNNYRILRVKYDTGKGKLIDGISDNGAYIFIPDNASLYKKENKSYIYLDYEGLPVDGSNGMPLILKGHESACAAFCVKNLYYEDFLKGKLQQNAWGFIVNDFKEKLAGSSTGMRYVTENEKKKYFHTLANMVQDFVHYKER